MDLRLSLREPSGRPFAPLAEAKLLDDLLRMAGQLKHGASQLIAVPELVAPFGTADLVVVDDPDSRLAARLECGIAPLLNRTDADIVSTLNARIKRGLEDVCRTLMWEDISIIERRIPRLLRVGAIQRSSRGGYLRHPDLVPFRRLHAFEAKVRDWRSGLQQARTYALWADAATLMLGHLPNNRDQVLAEAKRWSLGLADTNQILLRPRLRRHTHGRRLWASEHVAAAFLVAYP
jgi:hypothetical protein